VLSNSRLNSLPWILTFKKKKRKKREEQKTKRKTEEEGGVDKIEQRSGEKGR
jgi:hypothetical protein